MMKVVVFLTIFLLMAFVGCNSYVSVTLQDENISVYGYDLRVFSVLGFTFSPREPSLIHAYIPIGNLTIILYPQVTAVDSSSPKVDPEIFNVVVDSRGNKFCVCKPDYSHALKAAYSQASEIGANAMYDLKMEIITIHNGDIEYPAIRVTGFAVKIGG